MSANYSNKDNMLAIMKKHRSSRPIMTLALVALVLYKLMLAQTPTEAVASAAHAENKLALVGFQLENVVSGASVYQGD